MKIILLSGKPNTGKTSTFNLLYDTLTENGKKNIVVEKQKLGSEEEDFECVVKYNNKEIAMFSMGDVLTPVIDAIIKYSNRDVLVLAYSERFARELDTAIGEFKYHCVIKKTKSNERDCEKIISEL